MQFASNLPNDADIGFEVKDLLMRRTVEVQLGAFKLTRDVAAATWLSSAWNSFVTHQLDSPKG